MNKVFQWASSFLEDNSGGNSTTRAMLWIWIVVLCFNVSWTTIQKQPVDSSFVAVTAILASAKVVQRFAEKPSLPS